MFLKARHFSRPFREGGMGVGPRDISPYAARFEGKLTVAGTPNPPSGSHIKTTGSVTGDHFLPSHDLGLETSLLRHQVYSFLFPSYGKATLAQVCENSQLTYESAYASPHVETARVTRHCLNSRTLEISSSTNIHTN